MPEDQKINRRTSMNVQIDTKDEAAIISKPKRTLQ